MAVSHRGDSSKYFIKKKNPQTFYIKHQKRYTLIHLVIKITTRNHFTKTLFVQLLTWNVCLKLNTMDDTEGTAGTRQYENMSAAFVLELTNCRRNEGRGLVERF